VAPRRIFVTQSAAFRRQRTTVRGTPVAPQWRVLFRLPTRRPKVAAAKGGRRRTTAPPAARGTVSAQALADLATANTPDDAMALALAAVRDNFGAAAVAYCLFDPRRRTLRLAAEVGLSDDGCTHLRSAREGVPVGWDMPLHSLLNRRTYLIDSAARNRYVPPLVDNPATIGTVACVPVEAQEKPVGSLIVVTRAPRRLDERDILALRPVLRALAQLTHDLRRRAGDLWAASLAS
jgi:GAF domain-containing protein